MKVKFEGVTHVFPDDATDAEVASVLKAAHPTPAPAAAAPAVAPTVESAAAPEEATSHTIFNPWGIKDYLPKTLRVGINALASPATMASRAVDKIVNVGRTPDNPRLPMANLQNMIDTGMDNLGIAKLDPNSGAEQFGNDIAKTAPISAIAPEGLAGQMLTGALGNAIMAPRGQEASAATVGAALPIALRPLGSAVGYALRQAQNITKPAIDMASDVAKGAFRTGNRIPAAIDALDAVQPMIPGQQMTAADAASFALPEFKAFGNYVRTSPGSAPHGQIDEANRRLADSVLENMAAPGRRTFNQATGTTVPSQFEATRTARSAPFFAASNPDRIVTTPDIEAIVNGRQVQPSVVPAERSFQQAQQNAAVGGQPVPAGAVLPTPPRVDPASGFVKPGQPGTRSVEDLRRVKDELDGRIEAFKGSLLSPADKTERAQLITARQQLVDEMSSQSPNFANAQSIYRDASIPQNQAAIADVLSNKWGTGTGAFLKALRNPRDVMDDAGVFQRHQNIAEVMSSPQMEQIAQLRNVANRGEEMDRLQAAQGILPTYVNPTKEILMHTPGFLSKGATLFRGALRGMAGSGDTKTNAALSEAMLTPQGMRDLLTRLPIEEQATVINRLRSLGSQLNVPAINANAALQNQGD